MAIPFRHDPPLFHLVSFYHDLLESKAFEECEFFLFGLAFSVSVDKKRKLKNVKDFRPRSFQTMVSSFSQFISSKDPRSLSLSSKYFSAKHRDGPHTRPGYYSFGGSFLGETVGNVRQAVYLVKDSEEMRSHQELVRGDLSGSAEAREKLNSMRNVSSYQDQERASLRDRNRNFAEKRQANAYSSTREKEDSSEEFSQNNENSTSQNEKDENIESTFSKKHKDEGQSATKHKRFGASSSSAREKEFAGSEAKTTQREAEEIVEKGKVLGTPAENTELPSRFRIGRFDLSGRQRPKGFKETWVPVQRNDYKRVSTLISHGPPGGYMITGPTGCGKSTVALLPLFEVPNVTVMVVEPTQANAANIFHEFTNILPNMAKAGIIKGPVPSVQFVAPTVSKPPLPPLQITTTEKLLEYFYFNGKLPGCSIFVLDEFHLPVPTMVEVVELFRTFELMQKYVLVSATPLGMKVEAQFPQGLTHTYANLRAGVIPENLERGDLDPRRWFNIGDGTVAIFAPSVAAARKLFHIYSLWGLRAFLITRYTTVTQYMRAATDYRPRTVFVCEPAVEAGITLSISVLISLGATTAIRYDGRIVLEDTQPLDSNAEIQRGSRGARVKPTLYLTPRPAKDVDTISTADYFKARAYIKMVAMGALPEKANVRDLFKVFPKLATLQKTSASRAVSLPGDPFLAVYKTSSTGGVYKECGGQAEGFVELARSELYLYHYGSGFFVSPIADLSELGSKPDTFVARQSQFDAAKAMVDAIPGLSSKYSLEDLIAMVIGKFDVYVSDLFVRLKKIFNKSSPTPFRQGSGIKEAPEVKHFLADAPAIVKLFDYLATKPKGVGYSRVVKDSGDQQTAEISFSYDKIVLNFAFSEEYIKDNSLIVAKLSADIDQLLRGLLCIEILLNGAPEKCVDMENYKGRVSDSHVWFKTNVLRS